MGAEIQSTYSPRWPQWSTVWDGFGEFTAAKQPLGNPHSSPAFPKSRNISRQSLEKIGIHPSSPQPGQTGVDRE